MKLNLPRTNLEHKLKETRGIRVSQGKILEQVQEIFRKQDDKNAQILASLNDGSFNENNNFYLEILESDRIFHISDIEKICINYRLRFLDTKYFKGQFPYEALTQIKTLEKKHNTQLKGFKIIAPSKLFKLENADDPILMAPMGNNYFYLIHKWGRDLHPLRKFLMWPFRQLENFVVLLLTVSFLLALMVPDGMFSPQQSTSEFLMIFFFIFKWVSGLAIFYGFKKGKNFSSSVWRSKYYNA